MTILKHCVGRHRGNRLFSSLNHQYQRQESTLTSKPLTFSGKTEIEGSAEERMQSIFGGRIKGDARVSSSRKFVQKGRIIAGIDVPAKPTEPDNCCMSGCVNCVWEQYNDDIKDWRRTRNKAIEAIAKTDEKWPGDFNPPLKKLEFKNVPRELKAMKRKLSKESKVSTASYFPVNGKPGAQNVLKQKQEDEVSKEEEDEDWAGVPVSMRVFAKTEALMKKKKEERLARKLALEGNQTTTNQSSV